MKISRTASEPLIQDQTNWNEKLSLRLGVLAFTLSVIINLFKFPNYIFTGQMWAEMGTNYFPNSISPSLHNKLFATDSGYIPYPVRWFAAIVSELHLSSSTIPYIYTFSAILISAGLIAGFTATVFRPVIENDYLRFLICLVVSTMADFETRTFVNFTYLANFFLLACIILLAKNKLPKKSLIFIPLLICAKPLLMALTVPFFFYSWRRRDSKSIIVTSAFTILLVIYQVITVVHSRKLGVFAQATKHSLIEKFLATMGYFFGYLAEPFTFIFTMKSIIQIALGVLVFSVIIFVTLKHMIKNYEAIFPILMTLFLYCAINAFAVEDLFNSNYLQLSNTVLFRYTIPIIDCLLILAGIYFDSLLRFFRTKIHIKNDYKVYESVLAVLTCLIVSTGLGRFSEPTSPVLYNSTWGDYAHLIDEGASVCVPLNPIGWTYGQNCSVISTGVTLPTFQGFESIPLLENHNYPISFHFIPSASNLNGIGILVAPTSGKSERISAMFTFTSKTGDIQRDTQLFNVSSSGTFISMRLSGDGSLVSLKTAEVSFSSPLEIPVQSEAPGSGIVVTAYGN